MRYYSNGLSARLLAYFRDNPDEELWLADICAKFGMPMSTVRHAVSALKRGGDVESRFVVRLTAKGRKGGV